MSSTEDKDEEIDADEDHEEMAEEEILPVSN